MGFYTQKRDGSWAFVTEKQKQKLIDSGRKTEDDFFNEEAYIALTTPAKPRERTSAPTIDDVKQREPVQATRDLHAYKQAALTALSKLYSGNANDFFENIAAGNKPVDLTDDQRDLYNTAAKIINETNSVDNLEASLDRLDNRFARFASSLAKRKTWYGDDLGTNEILMPNLTARQRENLGTTSKVIGAAHDIMTLPARALTAGVTELLPQGNATTFVENMARPNELSNEAEKFADFTASSIIPGKIISSAGKAIGSGIKVLRAPTFAEIVADVNTPLAQATLKSIGQGAAKGSGEGLAYSAFPAAVEATGFDDNDKTNAGLTLLGGALTGGLTGAIAPSAKALTSKVTGKTNRDILTPFGEELTSGYNTAKRLESAIDKQPIASMQDQTANLAKAQKSMDDIADAIGDRRSQSIAKMENITDDPDINKKQLAYVLNFGLDKLEQNTLEANPAISTDLFPLLKSESDRIISNIKSSESPTAQQIKEITRLRNTAARTTDPEKKYVYNALEQELLDREKDNIDLMRWVWDEQNPSVDRANAANAVEDFAKTRDEFKRVLRNPLPSPDDLAKIGKSRYDVSINNKFVDYLDAQKSINNILEYYGYEPVDYITPAVASAVRKKMKPTEQNSFDKLLSVVTSGRSLYDNPAKAVVKAATLPVLNAAVKGAGASNAMRLLTTDGEIPVQLQAPIKKWNSVEDMK